MKILIVSHSCLVKENQKKIEALARCKDARITLLIPDRWREPLRDIAAEKVYSRDYRIVTSRVFFNGHIGGYFYPLSLVIRLLRERYDVIHIEEEPFSLSAFQFMALNRLISKSKSVIFTWENLFVTHRFPRNLMERFVLRSADFIIAGNSEAKSVLERKGAACAIGVLPLMGVDTGHFKMDREKELKEQLGLSGNFVVGYAGRLVPEKGLISLIDAISELDADVKCLMVGRGAFKEDMLKRMKEKGSEQKFVFIDSILHHEVPRYINLMDCLVLPSLTTSVWQEQFGHVLIEAMSCAVPVIGSDSGAIPEVIGDSGLIFREGDAVDLLDKIKTLVSSHELRAMYSEKGREMALNHFSHEKIAQRTFEIWKNCLEPRQGFERI